MSVPACPKCHAVHSRRIRQEGIFQQTILRRLGYYPWECRLCKAKFAVKSRGESRRGKSDQMPDNAAAG